MPIRRYTHASAGISALNPTPPVLAGWMSAFRGCFSAPIWSRILVLIASAVLAPGKRTVSQVLRVMGLAAGPGFARYHEVLSRARWDARAVARALLVRVLDAFSDAIAAVRRALWRPPNLSTSRLSTEAVEIPASLRQRLTDTPCHAA